MKKWIFFLAVGFFAVTAVVSGFKVYSIMAEYQEGEEAAAQLQQYISTEPARPVAVQPTTANEENIEPERSEPTQLPVNYPAVDFEALLEQNGDVVGWIYVEGTNINYPIVQGEDNQYYVDHMVNGQVNAAGSIFMDFRNQPDFSDTHTVIYGHNMKNKTMFAHIVEYRDPAFFADHPMGKIMTPDGNFQIEMIAGYVASLDDAAWDLDFEDDDVFRFWLQDALDRSAFDSGYVVNASDRIVTLSTCSYEFEDARFVLVCRVVE